MSIEVGLISLISNILFKDVRHWVWNRFGRTDPSELVKIRQKWKEEIQSHLHSMGDDLGYVDTIIRDIKRVDNYPNADDRKKGISPWFRVGILGIYHRGLQVVLRIEGLKYEEDEGGWRYCDYQAGEEKDINAYLVGRIPFERIVSIDWEGDEYYNYPHVYCHFTSKSKEPYEELIFCEKRKLDRFTYYSDLTRYDDVRRLTKRLKKWGYSDLRSSTEDVI